MCSKFKIHIILIIFVLFCILSSCGKNDLNTNNTTSFSNDSLFKYDYGVFLSIDNSKIDRLKDYKEVVIDAQYFEESDIVKLHNNNQLVYSYINIGSLENFRSYYDNYKDLTISNYENWDEERWVNVADIRWQNFISKLSSSLVKKGIDGFFVDNVDVYYFNKSDDIYDGVSKILKMLMGYKKEVIINGGDEFISEYRSKNNTALDVGTALNQESVFSSINFSNKTFARQNKEDHKFFLNYVDECRNDNYKIYLLEYSNDTKLNDEIIEYCRNNNFKYYISNSIELD